MKPAVVLVVALGCLAVLHAQTPQGEELRGKGKTLRPIFEREYPPDRTYAVAVRGDLPAIPAKGVREPGYPVEVLDSGWKGPGSMFRARPAGNLAVGEVLKVERIDYSDDRVELRLVSVDAREIVVDARRPERNRREQLVTLLTVPHRLGFVQLVQLIDGYVRLFPSLEAAREYARSLREPQPGQRFTLAVVRRDGILVPIANYDNGRWSHRWPSPQVERDVPIGLRDIPSEWWGLEGAGARWTLWTLDGRSRALKIDEPLAFGAHCQMNVGLRTDYRPLLPRPPLEQHHYPKDGLATTGTAPIGSVQILNAESSTWTSFEKLVAPHINSKELSLLWRLPAVTLSARSITPLKLEVLAMAEGLAAGSHGTYFEATRRYPAVDNSVPNPCGAVTFAQGWVHRNAKGAGIMDRHVNVQLTDCSLWDVEFRKPLGIVRLGSAAPVWVMEVSRWGGERYELVQVGDTDVTVLLSVPGGACKSISD